MITRVTGQLVEVNEDHVVVERGGIGYSVSIPRYAFGELAAVRGREITLHTILLVEGGQSGGHIEPALIGFVNAEDKRFFRRFVSVKGIGWRKALKALTESVVRVASWIEHGDVAALKRLPGIGARAAELIVAELKGKLGDIALAAAGHLDVGGADVSRFTATQRDALEIMVQLGDARTDAEQWLTAAARDSDGEATADEWLRAAYKIKAGVAV